MSNRNTFFSSVSALYHHHCQESFDYILCETDEMLNQIQYRLRTQAVFWTCFLTSDIRVVQPCRNLAGYFGDTVNEISGKPGSCLFARGEFTTIAHEMMGQCQLTGDAVVEVFPNRYGGRLGAVLCPLPWLREELGDALGLLWPLSGHEEWFQFAFRSFVGLRGFLVMDAKSNVLGVDPVVARRMASTPDAMTGRNFFEFAPDGHDHYEQHAIIREAIWTGRPSTWIDGNSQSGRQYELFQIPFFADGAVSRIVILGRELQASYQDNRPSALMRIIE